MNELKPYIKLKYLRHSIEISAKPIAIKTKPTTLFKVLGLDLFAIFAERTAKIKVEITQVIRQIQSGSPAIPK